MLRLVHQFLETENTKLATFRGQVADGVALTLWLHFFKGLPPPDGGEGGHAFNRWLRGSAGDTFPNHSTLSPSAHIYDFLGGFS